MMAAVRRILSILRVALPALVGLAVLVLVIAWLAGFFEEKTPPGQRAVEGRTLDGGEVAVVTEVTKDYEEEALGTLKAADRTSVSSQILARIDELTVDADDVVQRGQVLVRLQRVDAQARLSQAQQTLAAAEATRQEARRTVERSERLLPSNAISRQEYEADVRRLEVAEAEFRRAQQAVAEAEVLLSFTTIAAPRDGRIVDRLAEPGDMAIPGEPLLTLYDPKTLRLEVPVREELAVRLKPGDAVTVYVDALGREYKGAVAQRVPQAEGATRTFLVKVDLPAYEGLFEGMFGRLRIPVGQRRHLCVPRASVREIGQLRFVDVVRDDGSLERRFVKTGLEGMAGKLEVLSGVEAGERVVVHENGPPPAPMIEPGGDLRGDTK